MEKYLKVLVQFEFDVNSLGVKAELLGTTKSTKYKNCFVHLSFPNKKDESRRSYKPSLGGSFEEFGKLVCQEVNIIKIGVETELSTSEPYGTKININRDKSHVALKAAADIAKSFLQEYISIIRTKYRQHWLSHSAQNIQVDLCTVYDFETQKIIPIGYCDPLTLTCIDEKLAISTLEHISVLDSIESNESANLADLIFSDAVYLAWTSEPKQFREAILFAAIAAELTIKERLLEVCSSVSKDILEFALNNPRDVSFQAVSLFDKAAKAVTGKSLKEENKELYKATVLLFEHRNAIAHKAGDFDKETVRADLNAAEMAIAWTKSLV